MERIKEAIEKARAGEQPPRTPRKSFATPSAPAVPVVARHDPASRSSPPDASLDIRYTHTRVVHPDAACLEEHRIIAHQKNHPNSWAFDTLRTQVLQRMDEHGWRVLAVTSPTLDSGKTVVATNLAISIAQQTQRTALLMDFDLRRPSVATVLGLNPDVSLNDVLQRGANVADAMVNPGFERLVVLPTMRPVDRPAELLASPMVAGLIADLRDRYAERVLVVDLPPVLAADDVLSVLPQVDCVLLVVGSGASSEKEIEEAQRRLSRASVVGVVLNKDPSAMPNAYY
ncbi:MAG: protein tyrosine kinase [Burkholderiales bacterium]|nr:MAG: protein tyrosine kinase [Burkholderiales bacterium]